MQLTKLVINDAEIQRIAAPSGDLGQHVAGLADRVVVEAIRNASGRPGPRIRSGDLVEEIGKTPGRDEQGYYYDIASDAEHRGYPYPSRLETGQDGPYYPWLRPAFVKVMSSA